MTTKHKPATPLPWRLAMSGYSLKSDAGIVASVPRCHNAGNKEIAAFVEDADYAAHAANAYPRLIEALRMIQDLSYENQKGQDGYEQITEWARNVVRELGEE